MEALRDNVPIDVEWEIEQGIASALDLRSADSTAHLNRARAGCEQGRPDLATVLDAFIDAVDRCSLAQCTLNDAAWRFAEARAEQHAVLTRLQADLAATHRSEDHPQQPFSVSLIRLLERTEVATAGARNDDPIVTIKCFGRFEVHVGGEPLVPCRNRNGKAILRYLATHPFHRESSDVLMEAFWPDEPAQQARHKLHCAASALRKSTEVQIPASMAGGLIAFDNGMYTLNPAIEMRIDVDEVLAHFDTGKRLRGDAAIAEFNAACSLIDGTLLPDDLYAEWSVARRERLTQCFLSMCVAQSEYYERTGDYDRAAEYAQRILAENRCDETAFQMLIRARALAGHRAEAIRQYERCKVMLAADFGVAPLPSTTALYESMLRGELQPLPH